MLIWTTQEDERVCQFCNRFKGTRVRNNSEIERKYPSWSEKQGSKYSVGIPAHENCRCYWKKSGDRPRPTEILIEPSLMQIELVARGKSYKIGDGIQIVRLETKENMIYLFHSGKRSLFSLEPRGGIQFRTFRRNEKFFYGFAKSRRIYINSNLQKLPNKIYGRGQLKWKQVQEDDPENNKLMGKIVPIKIEKFEQFYDFQNTKIPLPISLLPNYCQFVVKLELFFDSIALKPIFGTERIFGEFDNSLLPQRLDPRLLWLSSLTGWIMQKMETMLGFPFKDKNIGIGIKELPPATFGQALYTPSFIYINSEILPEIPNSQRSLLWISSVIAHELAHIFAFQYKFQENLAYSNYLNEEFARTIGRRFQNQDFSPFPTVDNPFRLFFEGFDKKPMLEVKPMNIARRNDKIRIGGRYFIDLGAVTVEIKELNYSTITGVYPDWTLKSVEIIIPMDWKIGTYLIEAKTDDVTIATAPLTIIPGIGDPWAGEKD